MTFVKGQSGNPYGRPKDIYQLSEYARSRVPEVIDKLMDIINDPSERLMGRIEAAKIIMDRGMGALIKNVMLPEINEGVTIDQIPKGRVEIEKFLHGQK